MSKKDYKKFAAMIKERIELNEAFHTSPETCKVECHVKECEFIAREMAQIFADDNPAFDYHRFYVACGIEK